MIDYGIDVPNELECLPNSFYVECLEIGEKKTKSGFIIPTEKMDAYGHFVRPRWARVLFKAKDFKDVEIGDWVLLSHGRWSSSIVINTKGCQKKIWYVSPKSIKEGLIAISKTKPAELEGYDL